MNVYFDASTILRVVFGEPGQYQVPADVKIAVTSELALVESLRTIDRLRLLARLSDEEVAVRRAAVHQVFEHLAQIPVGQMVLARAREPFPTTLGTFDAIHLSSALLWQQSEAASLTFVTHEVELGRAAKAMGMQVAGC